MSLLFSLITPAALLETISKLGRKGCREAMDRQVLQRRGFFDLGQAPDGAQANRGPRTSSPD
jgi:hypothetical protein